MHTCFICKGRSRYYCFCCPWQAFCQNCVKQAEFIPVLRKTKGFCTNCLRMTIMIEKNVDVDSDGVTTCRICVQNYQFSLLSLMPSIAPVLLLFVSPFNHLQLADNSAYLILALEMSYHCYLAAYFFNTVILCYLVLYCCLVVFLRL